MCDVTLKILKTLYIMEEYYTSVVGLYFRIKNIKQLNNIQVELFLQSRIWQTVCK